MRHLVSAIALLWFVACSPLGSVPESHAVRVEDARFVTLGGIEQWITIRGRADAPVLLVVHGGPGDVQSPLVSAYAGYERDFLLVQWDQRGAGKTYGKYRASTPELTLDRLTRDGIELAEYLRGRFPRNGVIVLGHSWGTMIATQMVRQRPALFLAYVGTGQIASWAEGVMAQFELLVRKAKDTGDAAMLAELEAIGRPDPANAEQYFAFTRPLRKYLDAADAGWLDGLIALVRRTPGFTEADLHVLGDGMTFSGRTLLPFQMQENLSTSALRFEIPYFVIQGRDDIFTPTAPAEAYFAKLVAPHKRIAILDGAGHFALVTHAARFVAILNEMIAALPRRP
jgi:pimeloyl-ACP methyl ester carboxylesterase